MSGRAPVAEVLLREVEHGLGEGHDRRAKADERGGRGLGEVSDVEVVGIESGFYKIDSGCVEGYEFGSSEFGNVVSRTLRARETFFAFVRSQAVDLRKCEITWSLETEDKDSRSQYPGITYMAPRSSASLHQPSTSA